MVSARKVKARSANEVASLFLLQKLVQEKKRVKALQGFTALSSGASERGTSAGDSSFPNTCAPCPFRTIISYAQGTWLSKLMKRDRQSSRTVSFEGRVVGTWKYLGAGQIDPCYRLEFFLDAAFMQVFVLGNPVETPQPHATKKAPTVRLVAQLALPM